RARPSEHHHRAQDVTVVHPLERRLDTIEGDLLGHERVEVEPALLVQVDQHREVAARQTVAVPARLQGASASENVDQGNIRHRHVGCRYADEDEYAGQVACVERLLPGLRATDGLDDDVRALRARV